MNCKPCGKSFTGKVPYTQHVESEKHKRKVSSLNALGLSCQADHTCDVCHISFDSVQSYHNHSCKKQSDTPNDSNLDTNSGNMENEDVITDHKSLVSIDESFGNIECKICSKKFSGPVPYAAHIESASHKKKADMAELNLVSKETENGSNIFSCDPCKKKFTGPEPYKQHLASASHKKKTEIGIHSEVERTETFSCKPCKKVFTGKVPYEQHLISSVHKKKLKLIGISDQKKIDSNSECDVSNINKRWFCKFCHIQCSGQIPYKQHLEGDLHFKNAKIVPKHNNELKAEDVSTLSDATSEENIAVSTAISSGNNGRNEDIKVDLSQVIESSMPADNINEFISEKKTDVDIFEKEKENGSQDSLKEIDKKVNSDVDDKEMKSESYVKCKLCMLQLLNKEDALSHKCEGVSKERKSVKRLQPVKKEEETVKKLRSS